MGLGLGVMGVDWVLPLNVRRQASLTTTSASETDGQSSHGRECMKGAVVTKWMQQLARVSGGDASIQETCGRHANLVMRQSGVGMSNLPHATCC
jgi:hypothetical protein